MSFTLCQEETDKRRTVEHDDGNRDHVRSYFMESDDANDDAAAALLSGLLPAKFSQHPNDGGALLLIRTVEPVNGSHWHFRATLDYSTKLGRVATGLTSSGEVPGGTAAEMADTNPLNRPPDVFWDSETIQEVQEYDMDGRRYETSAGEPFDTPCIVERDLLALNLTKNVATWNPVLIATYTGATNESNFLGYEPGEVLIRKLHARFREEHGYFFWEVFGRFIFNPKLPCNSQAIIEGTSTSPSEPLYRGTWEKLILDAGYMELNGAGTKQQRIRDEFGQLPSRPVLLNGNGGQLTLTGGPDAVTAVYRRRRPRHRRNFDQLGLFS